MWTLVSVGTRRGGFICLFVWIRCSICVTARRRINLGCVCRCVCVCVFMWVCQTDLALLMHCPWECVFGWKDWLGIYERWSEAGVKSGARAGDRDTLLCFNWPHRSWLGQALTWWKVKVTRPNKCLFDLYFSCEVRNCALWTTSASPAFGSDWTVCGSHLSSFLE